MHQVDSRQEFIGRVNADEVLAGNAHQVRQTRTRSDKDRRVALFEKLVHRGRPAHDEAGAELDAERAQAIDLLFENLPRQPERWNAVSEHAA